MTSDYRPDLASSSSDEEDYKSPPRFAHTMAIARWLLLGFLTLFALAMLLTYFGLAPWAADGASAEQYHCPMHPTYITSQPGDCPICGMSLVPIASDHSEAAAMHTGEKDESAGARPGQYTCPMHPEVISDEPGRCPDCGMFLEQVPGGPDAAHSEVAMPQEHAAPPPSGVPGLVSVTLAPERLQMIGLRTDRVQRRALGGRLRLVGFVTPDETRVANVHVRVNGWVSKLAVDETGQYVKAGQPLLTLYSQDLFGAQQDLIIARDAARQPGQDSVMADLRRQLLQSARDRLRLLGLSDSAIADVEASDLPGQELTLRSPFSGYVIEKSVFEGQYVGPQSNLYTIVDLSRIWVLVDVYERDFSGVEIGQVAQMRLAAFPGEEFAGQVSFIYPSVSEQTRTLKLRLEFANPGLRLRPGMYADIQVDRGGGPVLTVPAGAVLDGGETQYAFVVHDGTHFEPRLVRVGQRSDDWMEVIDGLSEGEVVVTSANFLIDSESRLKAAITGMGSASTPSSGDHQH